MANIENRPFVGTWRLNNRTVVKYTPDALVFINGDTSMPGCPRCRGRLDIQRFVTSISVEAGVTPGSHSANISLSLPRVQGQQVFVDGNNILRAGLEVHVFMRGYFPVRGMFAHLPAPDDATADPLARREAQQISDIYFPNAAGTNRLDMSKYATYPYYPVFHGVVTQVSYDYSDGFYTGKLNCASLLHFWNYQNIVSSGAWQADAPPGHNDPGRTLFGHNFNNMHPFSIIYTLYRDVAGAAPGVDFAQDEETNRTAVDASVKGQGLQLFHMVALYWEQRFKTRVQDLRMYGVNGSLFNAVQQAWLASASNRDAEQLLTSPTYNEPGTTRMEKDPFSSRLSVAKALGLQNAGTDFVFSPLIGQDNELYNLSVLDMFAFGQAIAEMGHVNHWQSTYQTKLDVASQVMQVTGYEFYQDVDGDLVFKPPFYNLDISTNRFYRLEDQDIISISFVEREPRGTYQIVKGVWFRGITDGAPNVNEMLKRGMYIDYKLVAQFGWRPGPPMELIYVSDPKVCFWIAVARLDLLNVDTFSASCSIPIRPELRPGFPVYIPFADCYYYITQLSHQFAFGGSCTTSLVLTCRRTKWHAPGFLEAASEGKSAVGLIRLDRPDLPPRPLEIYDTTLVGGRTPKYIPRIVGFPNVVMALDPSKFDPNFSVVGIGIDYFDSVTAPADLLWKLLQRDVNSLDAFEAVGFDTVDETGKQVIEDPTQIRAFKLRYSQNYTKPFTLNDLIQAFQVYYSSRGRGSSLEAARQKQLEAGTKANLQTEAENRTAAENKFKGGSNLPRQPRTDQMTKLDEANAEKYYAERDATAIDNTLLQEIFAALQPNANKAIRRKVEGIAGSDVTLSWFQSLSHLKGQYMCSTIPGQYRYFSCSHPEETQQGMPIIEWADEDYPTVAGGAAASASRSRGKRGRSRTKVDGRVRRMAEHFEALYNIPGFADYTTIFMLNESDGYARSCNPDVTISQKALIEGQGYTPNPNLVDARGRKLARGRAVSKKRNQVRSAQFKRRWADSRYVDDVEAWNVCPSGGPFQMATTGTMTGVSNKKSKFRNMHPSDAIRIPCVAMGLFMAQAYRILQNPEWWQSLPPDQQTALNLRRVHGRSGSLAKEEAAKKWTVEEVNEYLIQDDFAIERQRDSLRTAKATLSATGGALSPEDKARLEYLEENIRRRERLGRKYGGKLKVRLRFKDPKSGRETFSIKAPYQGKKGFEASKQAGFASAGKWFRDALNSGMKLEDAVALANNELPGRNPKIPGSLPGDVWRTGLRRAGVGDRGTRADKAIKEACEVDGVDPDPEKPDIPALETQAVAAAGGAVEPQLGSRIKTTELSLENPRTVVQFKTTVTAPAGHRPPEVELGLAKCSKGLQVAQGPQRTPRVVTTDQIQSISFIRHKATKNTALTGISYGAGRNTFHGIDIAVDFTAQLFEAANQLLGDDESGEQTVSDLFRTKYEEIDVQVQAYDYPVYEDGNKIDQVQLSLKPFEEALVKPAATSDPNTGEPIVNIPAEALVGLGLLPAGGVPTPDLKVPIANLKLNEIVQLKGYTPDGSQSETSNKYERTLRTLAGEYGKNITGQIEAVWLEADKGAQEGPAYSKPLRLADVRSSFEFILGATTEQVGNNLQATAWSATQEKTETTGKLESPLHSPVFPVSDERGYAHYGAYRYGRGLSVEPGGTFEFIHSGQDPFKNVTAQTAEEFLNVLTLQKQGRISSDSAYLAGVRDAAVKIAQQLFEQRQEPLEGDQPKVAQKTGPTEQDIQRIEEALTNLAGVVQALSETANGRDILREMLSANGDDPNLFTHTSYYIFDTQFARNFANFSANYGKSAVFKTTAANAAYQLTDLTSHLVSRAGEMCLCRGSYSDIVMAAYSRDNFINYDPEDGVDREKKPESVQRETIRAKLDAWRIQQQQYRGALTQGRQPDAQASQKAGGAQAAAAGGAGPLPATSEVKSEKDTPKVSPDEDSQTKSTTANPEQLPSLEEESPASTEETPDTPPSIEEVPEGAEPEERPTEEQIEFEGETITGTDLNELPGLSGEDLSAITGLSEDQMRNILRSGDQADISALEAAAGFPANELSLMLGEGVLQ